MMAAELKKSLSIFFHFPHAVVSKTCRQCFVISDPLLHYDLTVRRPYSCSVLGMLPIAIMSASDSPSDDYLNKSHFVCYQSESQVIDTMCELSYRNLSQQVWRTYNYSMSFEPNIH